MAITEKQRMTANMLATEAAQAAYLEGVAEAQGDDDLEKVRTKAQKKMKELRDYLHSITVRSKD